VDYLFHACNILKVAIMSGSSVGIATELEMELHVGGGVEFFTSLHDADKTKLMIRNCNFS
jgi:hypothetical protein